jgi:flavodoxin
MNSLIIYSSKRGRTRGIAREIAEVLGSDLQEIDTKKRDYDRYDLIGFGSGIFGWQHHPNLLDLAVSLPLMKGKKAFIFSTAPDGEKNMAVNHRKLRQKLESRGLKIVGEFSCWGGNLLSILNTNRAPSLKKLDPIDRIKAHNFAKELMEFDR